MARGSGIIVSSNPKGVFLEGVIGDTSKPGRIMMISAGTAFIGGEPTWVAAVPPADGYPILIAVLDVDDQWGKTVNDAYVSGARCKLYVPAPGEDVNVIAGEGSSQTFTIGDRLQQKFNGNINVATSTTPFVPFVAMETVTAAVPYLLWVRRT